jgi:hypothetical protein
VRRSDRADIILDGMIDRRYRVPVLFAERRADLASIVVETLTRLRAQDRAPDHLGDDLALPMQIDGA